MKKKALCVILSSILLVSCKRQNVESNRFFFPMQKSTEEIQVTCELNMLGNSFEGTATLKIEQLSDVRLDHYYAIDLVDLKGTCDEHGVNDDSNCIFSSDFPIGYFYVDEDKIYMMSYDTGYREIFENAEAFPPDEAYIEAWETAKKDAGDHYGYWGYRLVCSEEGFSDTIDTENDDVGSDGKLYSHDYHNFISVDGDMRFYNLYPDMTGGTQEYLYITWKANQGITSYSNWSGNYKDYIAFCQAE